MIDWQSFHFIRAEWLLTILPLVLMALLFRYFKRANSGWQQVLPNHLHARLLSVESEGKNKKQRLPINLLIIAWILTACALAGPTWERLPQPVYNIKQGSVLVLDMSLSMRSTDLAPDRLTRARFKAIDLVNQLTDGEVGMVAYAGDAFIISPLTEDANNLIALIPSVSPEIMPIPGSEPLRGFEVATELLRNAGYNTGNIYWFTDGIERSQFQALANFAETSPFAIHTLMIGTQDGAPIKQLNGELLKDSRGAIVIPKSNPTELRAISSRSNGAFSRISAGDNDIDSLLATPLIDLDPVNQQNDEDLLQGDVWQDMGVYIAVLILPFAAYAFRRGLIMLFIVTTSLTISIGLAPTPVYAQSEQSSSATDTMPWYQKVFNTPNQLGEAAYSSEDYATATEYFEDPMWLGAAHYRNQNFEAALDAFKSAEGIEAIYNQGNSLAKLGKLKEAIEAYEQVIEQQPDHQNAIENKALLEQLMQEQEQQQQNEGENSSQEQQNSEQQDQNGEQNEQQSDDAQQSEDASSSDSGNQSSENTEQQNENNSQDANNSEQSGQDAQMRENQQPPEQTSNQNSESLDETDSGQSQAPTEESEAQTKEQRSIVPSDEPLTEEQKEQMQRMQNLLRKVPDDPAFLLQRKMQLENQSRLRERAPPQNRKNW